MHIRFKVTVYAANRRDAKSKFEGTRERTNRIWNCVPTNLLALLHVPLHPITRGENSLEHFALYPLCYNLAGTAELTSEAP